jgi:hypothetical protein
VRRIHRPEWDEVVKALIGWAIVLAIIFGKLWEGTGR